MSSSILVTGASGLLGYEVCRLLEANERSFTGLARSAKLNFSHGNSLRLDLTNSDALEVLEGLQPKVVIHCAAEIPRSAQDDGTKALTLNQTMDQLILELCQRCGARLIYISTTAVYGFPAATLLKEADGAQFTLTAYAQSKLLSERTITLANINSLVLRLNAPYGPRQTTLTVLKRFIEAAKANEDIYYYGSGQRKQDFTHVSDVAKVIVENIDRTIAGIFNVSYGEPISMKALAQLVISLMPGSTSKVLPAGKPDSQDAHTAQYDTTLAVSSLGWQPQVTLASGISDWINQ